MSSRKPTIVWLRRDLRLRDNPALQSAADSGAPQILLYIHGAEGEQWALGGASAWWLHFSLKSFAESIDGKLWIRTAEPLSVLQEIISQTGADTVVWNRQYEPDTIARDKQIRKNLSDAGIAVQSFNGSMCVEPWELETQKGDPYRVFTPYYRKWKERTFSEAEAEAPSLELIADENPVPVDELRLLPSIRWDRGFYNVWTPGEAGAHDAVDQFLESALDDYKEGRDRPATVGTSRLSPHLHFGEIAPWTVAERCRAASDSAEPFVRELAWREFSRQMLFYFPSTTTEPLNDKFADFPWHDDNDALQRWQAGQTGIPIIDAGMRELWTHGWMHNRVRMIVGSFLTKNLTQHWLHGARWFWDTLVDADLANNTQGWQWIAGCGADAAPYFRVFNPILQAEKFDPDSEYIKRWVPELKSLSAKHARAPWEAPESVLRQAGITLGQEYPKPLVDLKRSREQALRAYEKIK